MLLLGSRKRKRELLLCLFRGGQACKIKNKYIHKLTLIERITLLKMKALVIINDVIVIILDMNNHSILLYYEKILIHNNSHKKV